MDQSAAEFLLRFLLPGGNSLQKEQCGSIPSLEITYPLPRHFFEDEFSFPKVGYVSSLEGMHLTFGFQTKMAMEHHHFQ